MARYTTNSLTSSTSKSKPSSSCWKLPQIILTLGFMALLSYAWSIYIVYDHGRSLDTHYSFEELAFAPPEITNPEIKVSKTNHQVHFNHVRPVNAHHSLKKSGFTSTNRQVVSSRLFPESEVSSKYIGKLIEKSLMNRDMKTSTNVTIGARDIYDGRVLREFLPRILNRKEKGMEVILVRYVGRGVDFGLSDDQKNLEDLIKTETLIASQSFRVLSIDPKTVSNSTKGMHDWLSEKQPAPDRNVLLTVIPAPTSNHCIDHTFVSSVFTNRSHRYILFEVVMSPWSNSNCLEGLNVLTSLDYKVQLLASTHFLGKEWQPNSLFNAESLKALIENTMDQLNNAKFSGERVRSLFFATKGLDLAIPTRRTLLDLSSRCLGADFKTYERCGLYHYEGSELLQKCRKNPFRADIVFTNKNDIRNAKANSNKKFVRKWVGDSAEAACATIESSRSPDSGIECITRIIPKSSMPSSEIKSTGINNRNIIWIDLKSISHTQFKRSFQNLTSMLANSSIGVNSVSNVDELNDAKVLTSKILEDNNYALFSASDFCKRDSEKRSVYHHGSDLSEMLCYDFSWPNCVGSILAIEHLIKHATDFISAYSKLNTPWAAFLEIGSGDEDSITLIHTLEKWIIKIYEFCMKHNGFKGESQRETIFVISSNGGIDHGPFYRTPLGQQESEEAMIYIQSLEPKSAGKNETVSTLAKAYPLVLEKAQLKSISYPRVPTEKSELFETHHEVDDKQMCTFVPQPPSLSSFFSDISKDRRPRWPKCSKRKSLQESGQTLSAACRCASDHLDWYDCNGVHPWSSPSEQGKQNTFAMIMCEKDPSSISLDIRLNRLNKYVKKESQPLEKLHRESLKQRESEKIENVANFNILFIEIDSVSHAHADRHLVKTNNLLKKYNAQKDEESGNLTCPSGTCAFTFEKSSVVGGNSIPNQIAELSGCVNIPNSTFVKYLPREITENSPDLFFFDEAKMNCVVKGQYYGTNSKTCRPCPLSYILRDPINTCIANTTHPGAIYCCTPNPDSVNLIKPKRDAFPPHIAENLRLLRRIHRGDSIWCPIRNQVPNVNNRKSFDTPWLFDLAKNAGYVTFFGEEFCYEKSPYVVQDTYFETEPDYRIDKIFCRLSKAYKQLTNVDATTPFWAVEFDKSSEPQPCIDGRPRQQIAFEYLIKMWSTYRDVPKVAYLNALAAHDYGVITEYHHLGSEAYDDLLAALIEVFISSNLIENTLFIIRSDHGLQGGPGALDYSTQQEHPLPWSHMIFPESLIKQRKISLESIETNQRRLVTGFDLYKTMINLMKDLDGSLSTRKFSVPSWAYDLFTEEVPSDRSCADAGIILEHCPCLEEKKKDFVRPRFNVTTAKS